MKAICANCHSGQFIDEQYKQADSITSYINSKVEEATQIIQGLINDKIITEKPFVNKVSYDAFDLWHYYGRTAKFGAYMQGPDFVQWHGVYPLLEQLEKLKEDAEALRAANKRGGK